MERISALMDGESGAAESRQAIGRLEDDAEFRDKWETYHLIGDAMRGDEALRDDFMARFHERMQSEPTQLAPRRLAWRKMTNYALSAAASVCAVVVVLKAYPLISGGAPDMVAKAPVQEKLVQAPEFRPRPQPPSAQSNKVNEYLMAHQEYSPSTAFQGVAPYVRTVSESHDGNNR